MCTKETRGRKAPTEPGAVRKMKSYRLTKTVRDILKDNEPASHTETIEQALLYYSIKMKNEK